MANDNNRPCQTAAIEYANKGYFVFPIKPGEKKSRLSKRFAADGKNWGMSNNPETVNKNWNLFRDDSNIGLVTGEINNFFVVETDTKEGHDADGEAALRLLIAAHGDEWPETAQVRSPTGSIHYYFKWPTDGTIIRNSDSKLGPGVDVRGEGGMVLVPPSVRSADDMRCYENINTLPFADAPAWLLKLLCEHPETRDAGKPQAPLDKLQYFIDIIPNDPNTTWEFEDRKTGEISTRTGWEGWNDIGMAFFRASDKSDKAFTIFDKWCQRNTAKYDERYTRHSWYKRWVRSPPTRLGAGTIIGLAENVQPGSHAIWNEENAAQIKQDKIDDARARVAENKAKGNYEIKLSAGTNVNIYETEEYLRAAGVPIYVYGRTLVRPITIQVRAMADQLTKVAQLYDVEPEYLQFIANEHITYLKFEAKAKKWLPTDPPMKVIKGLLSLVGHWDFPTITGVISTPTMRYDGSIFAEPGYDPSTRLLMTDPPALPPLPEKPGRVDALEALELLDQLLLEFSFIDDVAKSVALSSIITPIVRGAFPVAPLHVNKAPTPASGKSYLFDVVAAIAIGQRMPTMAAGRNDEETEKRLGASLLAGQPLINVDNVNGELGGDAICQYIERPVVSIRVLGKSENRMVEASSTTLYATGNNITLVGDITRRALICTLDPNMERPEQREYKQDPIKMVLSNRGKYIAACLTICRAFMLSGAPKAKRVGSFEGWSDTVRSAIVWLGRADPAISMDLAREEDPRLGELENLMSQWARVIGIGEANALPLSKVIDCSMEKGKRGTGYDEYLERFPEFYEAVNRLASVFGRPPETKRLSVYLRGVKGRLVNGNKFVSKVAPSGGGTARWWVQHGNNPLSTTVGLRGEHGGGGDRGERFSDSSEREKE